MCRGWGNALCFLPGTVLKTSDLTSSPTMMFLTFSKLAMRWAPEVDATSFSWSNCYRTGAIVQIALPIHVIAFSVLFAPKFLMSSFTSLFKCSIWRSAGIFFPGQPCTFIK